MFTKIKRIYNEYPNTFKVLTFATFIDRFGSFLLFPFFSVYITERFGVPVTVVGFLFMILSAGSIIGSMIGGALADKYGRRGLVIIGLVASGLGSILMGLVNDLYLFFILAGTLGVIGDFGGPARQAMVVDLLPKEKQADGFGILRVAVNLSAVFGPILGGFIASKSYLLLFIGDAASSLITALIVYRVIPETKPDEIDKESTDTLIKSFKGYGEVLKDWIYVLFLSVSSITVLVYMQLNTTLSIFLTKVHGLSLGIFGLLLSTNAIMVVLFQFWITRRVSKYAPMKMMALGSLLYMIGFGMYGFVSTIYMFFIAMIILTVGEMIAMPIGQTAVASFSTEDKRARYMAVFGFHWAVPNLFGVLLSGLVIDYIGPYWLWYFSGILSLISAIGFWLLHGATKERFAHIKESLKIIEIPEVMEVPKVIEPIKEDLHEP
jgi:MFS family permease